MRSQSGLAALRDGALKAAAAAVLVLIGLTACDVATPKQDPDTPQPGKPPETWRSVLNLDATKVFHDVTWSESASRFVAVGALRGIGGVIMYSADGVRWTEATRTSDWLYGISHSEALGRFVAVGASGTVMYSADGANWSEGTSGNTERLKGVTWSAAMSRFVAVGYDGIVLHSRDGVSWSRAGLLLSEVGYLQDVAWSEALFRFVAVGYDYNTSFPAVAYSDDGTNWSMAAAIPGEMYAGLDSVAWSDTLSRFVAVGGSGTVMYSADGASWSAGTSGTRHWLGGVTWSDALSGFFAVGRADILYSTDGASWSAAARGDLGNFLGVTWSGARGVAVGIDGIATSADGNLWTMSAPTGGEIATAALSSVAWSDSAGRFVAVAGLRTIVHSSDGTTWSVASVAHETSGMYTDIRDVTWSDSLSRFVAVARNGFIWHSTDGESWVEVSDFAHYSRELEAVAWSDSLSRFVAVGYDRDARAALIAYSDDGTDWSMAASGGSSERLYGVAWSESLSRFVAVGWNGTILYSDDGKRWKMAASSRASLTYELFGVAWSDSLDRFAAVGDDGGVFYSDDGDQWYRASLAFERLDLSDVTWGGSHFVAVGSDGVILHSDDGRVWTSAGSTGTKNYLAGVTWSDSLSRYVAVGYGVILASP